MPNDWTLERLARLVANMREKQRAFFATRLPESKKRLLAASMALEAEVDNAVREILARDQEVPASDRAES